jgi:hypothetical protein
MRTPFTSPMVMGELGIPKGVDGWTVSNTFKSFIPYNPEPPIIPINGF